MVVGPADSGKPRPRLAKLLDATGWKTLDVTLSAYWRARQRACELTVVT